MSISDFRKKKLLYVFHVFFGDVFEVPTIGTFEGNESMLPVGLCPFYNLENNNAKIEELLKHLLNSSKSMFISEIIDAGQNFDFVVIGGKQFLSVPTMDCGYLEDQFKCKVAFDVNQSGEIDLRDFEIAIEKICSLRGWPADHPKNKETHDVMLRIWEGLRQKADKDNDGQVSVDEWCNMWDAYAKDPSTALDWQQRYMNFMFDLEDASNDGAIDAREFAIVCSSYGLDKKECEEAFNKMSQGQEEVTREQFACLWQEYFSAEDKNAPGNFIFGKTSF